MYSHHDILLIKINFQTAITIALEGLPSVVGAIGGWCTYDGPTIAAAVITFLIFLFDVSNKYSNE